MGRGVMIYILVLLFLTDVKPNNPCDQGGHQLFPDNSLGSRNERCNPNVSPVCDYYLTEGWYVAENATLLGKCPQSGNCGVSYPTWLNGTIPKVTEGQVHRNACIKQDGDCCKSHVTVVVKNCSSFLVYFLPALPACPMAYCFESKLPCNAQAITGTVHTYSSRISTSTVAQTSPLEIRVKQDTLHATCFSSTVLLVVAIFSFIGGGIIGWLISSKRFKCSNIKSTKVNPNNYITPMSQDNTGPTDKNQHQQYNGDEEAIYEQIDLPDQDQDQYTNSARRTVSPAPHNTPDSFVKGK